MGMDLVSSLLKLLSLNKYLNSFTQVVIPQMVYINRK